MEMGRVLIPRVYTKCSLKLYACHDTAVILHTPHYAGQHCQVYTIAVDATVRLLITICGRRRGFPYFEWDQTSGLVYGWERKFGSYELVFEPCYTDRIRPNSEHDSQGYLCDEHTCSFFTTAPDSFVSAFQIWMWFGGCKTEHCQPYFECCAAT